MQSPDARSTIQSWPKEAKKAAEMMIQKYGQPDEVTAMRVVETDHAFPVPHKDVLEQVIDYRVSTDKVDDLARYDGSVIVERTKGELSARCDMRRPSRR